MAQNSTFFGLPLATLQSLQEKYITCLEAIAVAGASYSIAGRSFTRANLTEVSNIIGQLQSAIEYASGSRVKRTVTVFSTQRP